jgi:hypothetical protein
MPTSKGKRSGCALRTVCARRSAWLCASSGQLRTAAACLSCKHASSRLCVTRPLGLPSQRVGGSRGPPNSFGAPTQVCGSPLERYPLMGRNGRRFCAFIVVWVRGSQRAFCRRAQGVTQASSRESRALSSFGVSLATVQTFTLDSAIQSQRLRVPIVNTPVGVMAGGTF